MSAAIGADTDIGEYSTPLLHLVLCTYLNPRLIYLIQGGVRGNHDATSLCNNNTFLPVFPASCPFVTSVGATQGFSPEKALNLTSGGFSNFFASPSYQSAAIEGFLKTLPSDFAGTFNKSGRGFPDVALQGWNFLYVSAGVTNINGGTSFSASTFAAIIALINDRLVAAGRPVFGFLNPFIHSTASTAFTDITIGHNSGFVCPASSVRVQTPLIITP
jgi:tripeptidyl-peptidase-1